MSRRLAALAALAGLVHAGNAAAAARKYEYVLLSPSADVKAPPPLAPGTSSVQTQVELRVPGPIATREHVDVGVGPDGVAVTVVATQRLLLTGTGDYSFVVAAPATKVGRGPDSESLPGLRDIGIVWQGFSNRRRVLSSISTLRPAPAAAGLPLRVRIEREGSATVVHLENITERHIPVVISRTSRADVLSALDELRASSRATKIVGGPYSIRGSSGHAATVDVAAPLHITGEIAQGTSRTAVDEQLGGGRPMQRQFTLDGASAPTLHLEVALLPPLEMLPTPSALARAPDPLLTLQTALGAIATSHTYRRYLGSPDPTGAGEISYVYRSAPKAAAVAAPGHHGGGNTLAIVLGILLGVAALAGLAAVWARS